MLKGILKFHKNKIEVCKNQESSHFFIPIPSEMCNPCLIQLVPSNASKDKSITKLLKVCCHDVIFIMSDNERSSV